MESLINSPFRCPIQKAAICPHRSNFLFPVGTPVLLFLRNEPPMIHRKAQYAYVHYVTHRHRKIQLTTFSSLVSLKEELSSDDSEQCSSTGEDAYLSLPREPHGQAHSVDELKTVLADSQRADLLWKLSEANQQNRLLKRQLQVKEDSLLKFNDNLVNVGREMQSLLKLADDISKSALEEGSGNINGQGIHPNLVSRLHAIHQKLELQIGHIDASRSREVPIVWYGMAESVQVMGSFDGWSHGEHLSSEYDGSCTKFSTTLVLMPGRYEIKFLVDGEWQISPQFSTVGDGFVKNNLLIVE